MICFLQYDQLGTEQNMQTLLNLTIETLLVPLGTSQLPCKITRLGYTGQSVRFEDY